MFRLWCKLFDESNHLMKDMVYANSDIDINRTKKIFDGIKEACYIRVKPYRLAQIECIAGFFYATLK